MAFFADPTITLSNKLLECVYIIIGLITIYAGVKNLLDKENPSRFGTFVFWTSFGVVCAFGHWLPARVSGALVVIMIIPAIFKRVKVGKQDVPSKEYTKKQFQKIGMKIFIPALTMGVLSLLFALFTDISALVGVACGVIISVILLMCYSKDNKPVTFLKDSERLLSMMGPLCMLPQLLGALGGVFTAAGVGDVIGRLVSGIVPEGNVTHHRHDHRRGRPLYSGLRRGSRGGGHDRLNLRLLRHSADPHGGQLQHCSRGGSGHEGPVRRDQKAGPGGSHHAGNPDHLHDRPSLGSRNLPALPWGGTDFSILYHQERRLFL